MLAHKTALHSDVTHTNVVNGIIVYVTTAEAALHHNKAKQVGTNFDALLGKARDELLGNVLIKQILTTPPDVTC